jgi:hypothetical protein
MRKIAFVFGILCACVLFSCKKESDPAIPPPFYPPNDTTLHTTQPLQILLDVSNGSEVYNAWGKLIALKSDSAVFVGVGDTVYSSGEYGIAFFLDSELKYNLDAGSLTLNNISIPHPNAYYSYKGTTDSLEYDANWISSGSAEVPAISFNQSGGFPAYSGTLPWVVSKSIGISFTFNASTVSNADSVYVVLTAINDTGNIISYNQSFGATQGDVTITGSDFNYLPSCSITQGHLTIIPYRYTTAAFGDKKFVFVKQAEISHSVSIQ